MCALACWLGAGCNAYDASLLQLNSANSQLRIVAGNGDGTPAAGSGPDAAAAGGRAGDTAAGGGAGGGASSDASGTGSPSLGAGGMLAPPAAGASSTVTAGSAAPTTRCGDGDITGAETCDIAIEAGMPGACPTECPPLSPCTPRALNGTGCQSECVLIALSCEGGDDCCPNHCSAADDSDCSAACGDGVIQRDAGETCEPSSSEPCKQNDSECADSDACTADTLTGSADNCNSACLHAAITQPRAGDGCCPPGADANTDSDCQPKCGNGVREAGEACDGSVGCDMSCTLTLQPQQLECLERFGTDDCGRCSCMNCVESYMACRAGSDATANDRCHDILVCAKVNDCLGTACYCADLAWCALTPGPCKAPIEAAAGTTNPFAISQQSTDTNTTVGRAYAADLCRVKQCASVCRPAD